MSNIDIINNTLYKTLAYAESEDYKGYNKYDALDSKLLTALAFGNKYLRLVYSQVIMRSPVNIRPMLLVPKTHNPKGMALFAMAWFNIYRATQDQEHLDKGIALLNWLLQNPSTGYVGTCWGYQYPWQDVGFFAPANLPNRVVTFFVCSAFLDGYDLTKNETYLETVKSAAKFLLDEPKILFESKEMKCMSYVPDNRINWIVMDVSALCGAILARLYSLTKEDYYKAEARRLIYYVVDKQTDYGAWFYTHPAGDHHKTHDNYHTGYIIDAILDYSRYTGDDSFMGNYKFGLKYYKDHLFLPDGAPKWMNDKIYPLDVHGSAQGIISFMKAAEFGQEYVDFAHTIARWAIDNMYVPEKGYFYYQKHRYYTKRFTLMRWCNGWMSRGLSTITRSHNE